jgi:hypothetical protein
VYQTSKDVLTLIAPVSKHKESIMKSEQGDKNNLLTHEKKIIHLRFDGYLWIIFKLRNSI